MSETNSQPVVVLVGSGFSGTLVAVHLLRHRGARPPRIVLIERNPGRRARGVAYGTRRHAHLLNVPVAKMSAFPDMPEHFHEWARRREPDTPPTAFLPRMSYGDYLREVLDEAEAAASATANDDGNGARLERIDDEAIDVEPRSEQPPGGRVVLRSGRIIDADRVVFAFGNFPPADPPVAAGAAVYANTRYVRDPWVRGALDAFTPDEPVLLIGTGLTMLDVVLALRERGHRARLHALSRHGLLPQTHYAVAPLAAAPDWTPTASSGLLLRELVRRVRDEVRHAAATKADWRAVIDSLRAHTPSWWRALPEAERRRFLRHVRHFWDAHRHRVAPQVADVVGDLIASGQLNVHAGRITKYRVDTSGIEVHWRRRGDTNAAESSLRVARIVNCTGPNTNLEALREPLLDALRARGLLRPDSLALGCETANDGALVGADGTTSATLYTLGSWRRPLLWETTAVPEIRAQAAALAAALLASL